MNGQWLGRYSGSAAGAIILDIDERQGHYEGTAYLIDDDRSLADSLTSFKTTNKDSEFEFRTDVIVALDPQDGHGLSRDELKQRMGPNQEFSKYADVSGKFDEHSLSLRWVMDTGLIGECTLPRSRAGQPSELVAAEKNWTEFREYVTHLEGNRLLFRGQNAPWRLRTSFHRRGRSNLSRFLQEDLQLLHRNLSARTKHVFNLQIPDENGAFLNLIQHHGYPTPLLDWTYSPYVAAFFAYRGITNQRAASCLANEKVRIYVFDQENWRKDMQQILFLVAPRLHVSVGEFIAIENERMIPQQAATIITNVDDIETYIRSKEANGKTYLQAIDLPVRERPQVVCDLSYMGITAGALFPGLDGACEELTQRNFDI